MTDSIDPRGDQMARDLIAHVKRTYTPRLALLEDRIAAAIEYLDKVGAPNRTTLSHIRWFLVGDYDSVIALRAANDPDADRSCGCGGIGVHGVDHPEVGGAS